MFETDEEEDHYEDKNPKWYIRGEKPPIHLWAEHFSLPVKKQNHLYTRVFVQELAVLKIYYPYLESSQQYGKTYASFGIPNLFGEVLKSFLLNYKQSKRKHVKRLGKKKSVDLNCNRLYYNSYSKQFELNNVTKRHDRFSFVDDYAVDQSYYNAPVYSKFGSCIPYESCQTNRNWNHINYRLLVRQLLHSEKNDNEYKASSKQDLAGSVSSSDKSQKTISDVSPLDKYLLKNAKNLKTYKKSSLKVKGSTINSVKKKVKFSNVDIFHPAPDESDSEDEIVDYDTYMKKQKEISSGDKIKYNNLAQTPIYSNKTTGDSDESLNRSTFTVQADVHIYDYTDDTVYATSNKTTNAENRGKLNLLTPSNRLSVICEVDEDDIGEVSTQSVSDDDCQGDAKISEDVCKKTSELKNDKSSHKKELRGEGMRKTICNDLSNEKGMSLRGISTTHVNNDLSFDLSEDEEDRVCGSVPDTAKVDAKISEDVCKKTSELKNNKSSHEKELGGEGMRKTICNDLSNEKGMSRRGISTTHVNDDLSFDLSEDEEDRVCGSVPDTAKVDLLQNQGSDENNNDIDSNLNEENINDMVSFVTKTRYGNEYVNLESLSDDSPIISSDTIKVEKLNDEAIHMMKMLFSNEKNADKNFSSESLKFMENKVSNSIRKMMNTTNESQSLIDSCVSSDDEIESSQQFEMPNNNTKLTPCLNSWRERLSADRNKETKLKMTNDDDICLRAVAPSNQVDHVEVNAVENEVCNKIFSPKNDNVMYQSKILITHDSDSDCMSFTNDSIDMDEFEDITYNNEIGISCTKEVSKPDCEESLLMRQEIEMDECCMKEYSNEKELRHPFALLPEEIKEKRLNKETDIDINDIITEVDESCYNGKVESNPDEDNDSMLSDDSDRYDSSGDDMLTIIGNNGNDKNLCSEIQNENAITVSPNENLIHSLREVEQQDEKWKDDSVPNIRSIETCVTEEVDENNNSQQVFSDCGYKVSSVNKSIENITDQDYFKPSINTQTFLKDSLDSGKSTHCIEAAQETNSENSDCVDNSAGEFNMCLQSLQPEKHLTNLENECDTPVIKNDVISASMSFSSSTTTLLNPSSCPRVVRTPSSSTESDSGNINKVLSLFQKISQRSEEMEQNQMEISMVQNKRYSNVCNVIDDSETETIGDKKMLVDKDDSVLSKTITEYLTVETNITSSRQLQSDTMERINILSGEAIVFQSKLNVDSVEKLTKVIPELGGIESSHVLEVKRSQSFEQKDRAMLQIPRRNSTEMTSVNKSTQEKEFDETANEDNCIGDNLQNKLASKSGSSQDNASSDDLKKGNRSKGTGICSGSTRSKNSESDRSGKSTITNADVSEKYLDGSDEILDSSQPELYKPNNDKGIGLHIASLCTGRNLEVYKESVFMDNQNDVTISSAAKKRCKDVVPPSLSSQLQSPNQSFKTLVVNTQINVENSLNDTRVDDTLLKSLSPPSTIMGTSQSAEPFRVFMDNQNDVTTSSAAKKRCKNDDPASQSSHVQSPNRSFKTLVENTQINVENSLNDTRADDTLLKSLSPPTIMDTSQSAEPFRVFMDNQNDVTTSSAAKKRCKNDDPASQSSQVQSPNRSFKTLVENTQINVENSLNDTCADDTLLKSLSPQSTEPFHRIKPDEVLLTDKQSVESLLADDTQIKNRTLSMINESIIDPDGKPASRTSRSRCVSSSISSVSYKVSMVNESVIDPDARYPRERNIEAEQNNNLLSDILCSEDAGNPLQTLVTQNIEKVCSVSDNKINIKPHSKKSKTHNKTVLDTDVMINESIIDPNQTLEDMLIEEELSDLCDDSPLRSDNNLFEMSKRHCNSGLENFLKTESSKVKCGGVFPIKSDKNCLPVKLKQVFSSRDTMEVTKESAIGSNVKLGKRQPLKSDSENIRDAKMAKLFDKEKQGVLTEVKGVEPNKSHISMFDDLSDSDDKENSETVSKYFTNNAVPLPKKKLQEQRKIKSPNIKSCGVSTIMKMKFGDDSDSLRKHKRKEKFVLDNIKPRSLSQDLLLMESDSNDEITSPSKTALQGFQYSPDVASSKRDVTDVHNFNYSDIDKELSDEFQLSDDVDVLDTYKELKFSGDEDMNELNKSSIQGLGQNRYKNLFNLSSVHDPVISNISPTSSDISYNNCDRKVNESNTKSHNTSGKNKADVSVDRNTDSATIEHNTSSEPLIQFKESDKCLKWLKENHFSKYNIAVGDRVNTSENPCASATVSAKNIKRQSETLTKVKALPKPLKKKDLPSTKDNNQTSDTGSARDALFRRYKLNVILSQNRSQNSDLSRSDIHNSSSDETSRSESSDVHMTPLSPDLGVLSSPVTGRFSGLSCSDTNSLQDIGSSPANQWAVYDMNSPPDLEPDNFYN